MADQNLETNMLHTIGKALAYNGTSTSDALNQIQDMVVDGMGGTYEDAAMAVRAYFDAKNA